MARILQTNFAVYPARGFPGMIAQPGAPMVTDVGPLHVPTPGTSRNPRPGDALYYDTTEDAFAIPTTAAQSLIVCGILGFRQDHIGVAGSAVVEYEDEDQVQVIRVGSVWVTAGSAIEYNGLIAWDRADYKWDALTAPAAFANLVDFPIYCADRNASADNAITQARIGYGRIK